MLYLQTLHCTIQTNTHNHHYLFSQPMQKLLGNLKPPHFSKEMSCMKFFPNSNWAGNHSVRVFVLNTRVLSLSKVSIFFCRGRMLICCVARTEPFAGLSDWKTTTYSVSKRREGAVFRAALREALLKETSKDCSVCSLDLSTCSTLTPHSRLSCFCSCFFSLSLLCLFNLLFDIKNFTSFCCSAVSTIASSVSFFLT